MKLSTRLFGQTYSFKSVKEVLAKANEPRSGDVLAGEKKQVLNVFRNLCLSTICQ